MTTEARAGAPRGCLAAAALALAAGPAAAASLTLQITLPEIKTASYYRPYLAAWVEKADEKAVVGTLAVWYDTRLKDGLGKGWLRNLRTWWGMGGEQLALPVDGITGATRPVGTHALHFAGGKGPLAQLPPGRYQMVVEAVREQGERELLRVPFEWGRTANTARVQGSKELGQVTVDVAD
ncbi:putative periplasmic protein [Acidovorax sp. CF316]|uniref:DUF2271 domain-containing protein n=1 Tax=Acidovorax sp. CF316 TaxID=1144317 RepID=UPI00026BEC5E|nr:DUF2271 domain-containing protein [Acidovorax sp. CF316]EJE49785.1 putative periplasmic protein [Acidovorax sp. CF316]